MEVEMLSEEDQTERKDKDHDCNTKDTSNVGTETTRERRIRFAKQILIILGAASSYQNEGMALSWPNTFASDIQTDRTNLFNSTLTVEDWQMDMTSSALYIGSTLATPFAGWLVSTIGRRWTIFVAAGPTLISWLFVALAVNTPMILAGRYIAGVGSVIQAVAVRPYLVEVSDDNIRGAAGVMTEAMKGIGAMSIIAIGMAWPWYYLALVGGIHIFVYALVVVPFLPESPTFLVVNNRTREAKEILRSLKGPDADLDDIIQKLKKKNERMDGSEGLRVLLKPDIIKKCSIVLALFLIGNFCGSEVIRGNATRMLQSSGQSLDKDISTIIVFAVLLGGNIAQVFVLDRIGRRRCLVLSLTLLLFSYTLLGTYIYITTPHVDIVPLPMNGTMEATQDIFSSNPSEVQNQWGWIPTFCLMVAAFSLSLGIGPIPWLLSTEYFPTNIRPKVLAVCIIMSNLMAVCAYQLYSPMLKLLSPAGLFWCYACSAAIGILFTIFFVTETKGISIG